MKNVKKYSQFHLLYLPVTVSSHTILSQYLCVTLLCENHLKVSKSSNVTLMKYLNDLKNWGHFVFVFCVHIMYYIILYIIPVSI